MPGSLNRIAIIGRSGSGKSSLALQLGSELGVPVFHTDALGWLPGWRQRPFAAYRRDIAQIVGKDRWIVDGNSPRTCDLRFPVADAIIWLDPPRWRCLLRVLVRTLKHFGRQRPTSAPGCSDRFSALLFGRFFAFDRNLAPKLRLALARHAAEDRFLLLTSCREARRITARDLVDRLAARKTNRDVETLQSFLLSRE